MKRSLCRSRLDVARMFVKVGSSLRIPFSVSVNVSGFLHKIIVAVEDSTMFDKTEVASGRAKEESSRNSSLEVSNVRLTSYFSRELEASAELNFGSQFAYDYHYANMGYCSFLLETEMIGGCHNGFPPRLGGLPKIKWSRHRSFLYGCDRSPGTYVSELGTGIPNQNDTNGLRNWTENLKSGSLITREEGLAPSRRPFENGTN